MLRQTSRNELWTLKWNQWVPTNESKAKTLEKKVCKLLKSIYGLKLVSCSWNISLDKTVKSYGLQQNVDDLLVYKHFKDEKMDFLVLYVDDILFRYDVGMLTLFKVWLAKCFDMKDLGEANYVLGIQLYGDWKNKIIALSQSSYINKVFEKFAMQDSNKGGQPSRIGITLSLNDCPRHSRRNSILKKVPYASIAGIFHVHYALY